MREQDDNIANLQLASRSNSANSWPSQPIQVVTNNTHRLQEPDKAMASDFLKEFVACAGAALKAEDQAIIDAGHAQGQFGGLLRTQQEKFYQYIIWKAVIAKWPFEVEKNYHDLIKVDPLDHKKYECTFEIKKWLNPGPPNNKQQIENDVINKLRSCKAENSAFILISANNRGFMHQQIRLFVDALLPGTLSHCPETSCFTTTNPEREEVEFWIAVWPIKPGPLFSK